MAGLSQGYVDARLFGRDGDLEKLEALFAEERLVTLLGPGGIGKTSLALAHAKTRKTAFVVDWSDARDGSTALVALAHAVGARGAAGEKLESSIEAALAKASSALLVLDNCEQIIDEAARLVTSLLRTVPGLRVLATSRELLRVDREIAYALEPLAFAGTPEALAPAVELFIDRARRARPGYDFRGESAVVSAIAAKLEGIPLAIELAAARMGVLDAKGVLDRLDAPFALLRGGSRSAPARQRTLLAAIEGSWTPLSPFERSALAQCSVFRGGFALEAAEAVVDLGSAEAPPVLDLLQSLAQKSLLRVVAPPGFPTETRFQFFESIRDLAREKLSDDPEAVRVANRHRAYFLELGSRWEANHWHGGLATVRRLALERENLLMAREHAKADASAAGAVDFIRAAIALHPIFAAMGPFSESPALLDRARMDTCLADAPPALRARFFLVRGRAEQLAGDRPRSRADFEQALGEAQRAGDDRLEARALVHLGTADRSSGAFARARERFEAALGRFEACGDEAAASVVLSALGALDLQSGALVSARERVARAAEIQRAHGDRATLGMMLIDLGIIEQELGRFDDARRRLDEARAIHTQIDNRRFYAVATGYLANLDLEQGSTDAALRGYTEAISVLEPIGDLKFETLFGACLASIRKDSQALDRIEERARARVEDRISTAVSLHRARTEWLAIEPPSPADEKAALRRRIEATRAGAIGLERESDDVRFASRLLDAALGSAPCTPDLARKEGILYVARDGGSFRGPTGQSCDLSRRDSARRILLLLVRSRIDAPGRVVTASELIAAGWPGERISEAAAKNRLHVTLTKLRESGLREVLVGKSGGQLLDPTIEVLIGPD